ncbi:MAG: hypothetical protein GQ526_04350, partial [Ardenticatenales bacterium]|nr:hypothetical protein [Ardenticatenales bacterium]
IWAALAIPVIRMLEGARSQSAVVALLFSVLMGANLLRPMDMPAGLQMAHLIEVAGANLIFGLIVVRLLRRPTSTALPRACRADHDGSNKGLDGSCA